jgi:hypothetical protein
MLGDWPQIRLARPVVAVERIRNEETSSTQIVHLKLRSVEYVVGVLAEEQSNADATRTPRCAL